MSKWRLKTAENGTVWVRRRSMVLRSCLIETPHAVLMMRARIQHWHANWDRLGSDFEAIWDANVKTLYEK